MAFKKRKTRGQWARRSVILIRNESEIVGDLMSWPSNFFDQSLTDSPFVLSFSLLVSPRDWKEVLQPGWGHILRTLCLLFLSSLLFWLARPKKRRMKKDMSGPAALTFSFILWSFSPKIRWKREALAYLQEWYFLLIIDLPSNAFSFFN